ncbi:hypothetical protein [Streptomyces sp. KL116D]|uniref:hypothetical protein n=1 Tax=Streptomyces sp. KL116D TaxID=3045152 RepID=UPI003558A332
MIRHSPSSQFVLGVAGGPTAAVNRLGSSATHQVKIIVVGASGRPTITTDGLVSIK